MPRPCPACGCRAASGAGAHALQAALLDDDLDAAFALGLLDVDIICADCSAGCRDTLQVARDERLRALAARDRFRVRAARLATQQRERAERRAPAASAEDSQPGGGAAALPPAAAAALARAKAKAAGRQH